MGELEGKGKQETISIVQLLKAGGMGHRTKLQNLTSQRREDSPWFVTEDREDATFRSSFWWQDKKVDWSRDGHSESRVQAHLLKVRVYSLSVAANLSHLKQ